jgi:hypothetical protein
MHDEYYCNDSIYSNLNILFVTGVVHLEHYSVQYETVSSRGSFFILLDGQPTARSRRLDANVPSIGIQQWESLITLVTTLSDSDEGTNSSGD